MTIDSQPAWRELGLGLGIGIITAFVFWVSYECNRSELKKAINVPATPVTPPPRKPRSATTFRVRKIPRKYDRRNTRDLLKDILQLDDDFNDLRIRSLAIDATDLTTSVATIDFDRLPNSLQAQPGNRQARWVFKLPGSFEDGGDCTDERNIVVDTQFFDLSTFSSPSLENHEVDIIAVAGLSAHPFHSFRSQTEDYMWLRDSLPSDIPGARVMVYGSDSHWSNAESFQDLDALGRGFCNSLQAIQSENDSPIPKIFIGHSLGGLVIKQSMILMRRWNNEASEILFETYGVIFLGVPNQGMKIEHLLAMVEGQPNEAFIHSLSDGSQLLTEQCQAFEAAFDFEDSEVACFYETCRSPTIRKIEGKWVRDGPAEIFVGIISAQHARGWETGSKVIPINKSHSMMARFNENDEDYSRMKLCVRQMAHKSTQVNITRRTLLHHTKLLDQMKIWLDPPLPEANHDRARSLRKAGSGRWFIESEVFSQWKRHPASPLWLQGKPGCGKTVLSATIIEDIVNHLQLQRKACLAYYYFDFNDTDKQTLIGLLRSLLFQLFCRQPKSVDLLFPGSDAFCTTANPPPTEKLTELLDSFVSNHEVYLVIDALDECREQSDLLSWLTSFVAAHEETLHLLVTSRREALVTRYLKSSFSSIPLETRGVDADIADYTEEILEKHPEFSGWPLELKNKVSRRISGQADGMFRWAVCQIEALKGCDSLGDVEEQLESLPATLDETYERALWKIPEHLREQSFRLFQWIIYAVRPLSSEEAIEVLITSPDEDGEVDLKRRPFSSETVLKYCGSLVTIRDLGQGFSSLILAHYSVKEYLTSDRIKAPPAMPSITAPKAHATITGTLMQYMRHISCQRDISSWETLHDNYPLGYYLQHLHRHLTQLPVESSTSQLFLRALKFINCYDCRRIWAYGYKRRVWSGPQRSVSTLTSSPCIVLACFWGALELVRLSLEYTNTLNSTIYVSDINPKSVYKQHIVMNSGQRHVSPQYALQCCATLGNRPCHRDPQQGTTYELELDIDSVYRDALRMAIKSPSEREKLKIVKLILDHGSNLKTRRIDFQDALEVAISKISKDVAIKLQHMRNKLNDLRPDFYLGLSKALLPASEHELQYIRQKVNTINLELPEHYFGPYTCFNPRGGDFEASWLIALEPLLTKVSVEVVKLLLDYSIVDPWGHDEVVGYPSQAMLDAYHKETNENLRTRKIVKLIFNWPRMSRIRTECVEIFTTLSEELRKAHETASSSFDQVSRI